jgi:hypothetical protein
MQSRTRAPDWQAPPSLAGGHLPCEGEQGTRRGRLRIPPVPAVWLWVVLCFTAPAFAMGQQDIPQGAPSDMASTLVMGGASPVMVTPPASIMGAVMLPQGHFMDNFMPMWMHMDGLGMGTDDVSPDQVVTTVPNRFAGQPMPGFPMMRQPAYIRSVPQSMDMSGQMLGLMYGLTDSVNLMVMGTYLEKDMTMLTYRGASGDVALGTSGVSTKGFGDTSARAWFKTR